MKRIIKSLVPDRVMQSFRSWKLRRELANFSPRVARHSYHGYEFSMHLRDRVAESWYGKDWDILKEIEILEESQLVPGSVVFDLGAHQGLVGMILASKVGESGKIVAVEGSSRNCEIAKKNFELNQIENVDVVHAVAAEKAGEMVQFSENLNGSVTRTVTPTRIESVSVDSLASVYGRPQVVFVDVEGYECQVLRGAKSALKHRADFFVEVHIGVGLEDHGSLDELLGFFPEAQFDRYVAEEEGAAFEKYSQGAELPKQRFYLVAIGRTH
ncbi:MAG: FkbM family methyltransferase [Verrucomicrobiota bacterium]